jgi:4-diphosphocytidyl-2-C-methyl-D-erythritol kinase
MRYTAPAKVNLALEVGPLESSGFHPLDSVVQTISLADDVVVEAADRDVVVVAGDAPVGSDNLAMRAVLALRRRVAVPPVRIELTKRLPTAAGLGGGSADAAAALVAAARLAGFGGDLAPIAAEVGSDVPALLLGGTTAMRGRGEVVEPLPPVGGVRWLVAVPPFGAATPAVYHRWDVLGGPTGEEKPWPSTGASIGRPVRNDLEPAALAEVPGLGGWLAALGDVAGRPAMVSGSGSAAFVEVDDEVPLGTARSHPLLGGARLLALVTPVAHGPRPL